MTPVNVFCKHCRASRLVVEDGVCPGCKREICTACGSTEPLEGPHLIYWNRPGLCERCHKAIARLSRGLMTDIMKEAA